MPLQSTLLTKNNSKFLFLGGTILMVVSHDEDTNVDFSVGDQCTENTSRECSFQLCIGNSYPINPRFLNEGIL